VPALWDPGLVHRHCFEYKYLGATRFESWLTLDTLTEVCDIVFFSPSKQIPDWYLDEAMTASSEFFPVHQSSYHLTLYNLRR
jgi:hypothetical protein